MEYKTIKSNYLPISCSIITILKNIIISYILSILLLIIFSFIITYSNISYSAVSPISVSITIISIITASFFSGRKSSEKGWLTGCVTGFMYMLILYAIGSVILKNPGIQTNGILMVITGIISGALGSIIGINNKPKK